MSNPLYQAEHFRDLAEECRAIAALCATSTRRFVMPRDTAFDRSLVAKLRRRCQYFFRYLSAMMQKRQIYRLLPIVSRRFSHRLIGGTELKISLFRKNKITATWQVQWDAPIGVLVLKKRKGKRKPAFGMSLYIDDNTICIQQLQGYSWVDLPDNWPVSFIEACMEFARQENLRAVRVPMAHTLYSYRYPYLHASPSLPMESANELQEIRTKMESLYDATALQLGFVATGDWYQWNNPCYVRQHKVSGASYVPSIRLARQ